MNENYPKILNGFYNISGILDKAGVERIRQIDTAIFEEKRKAT